MIFDVHYTGLINLLKKRYFEVCPINMWCKMAKIWRKFNMAQKPTLLFIMFWTWYFVFSMKGALYVLTSMRTVYLKIDCLYKNFLDIFSMILYRSTKFCKNSHHHHTQFIILWMGCNSIRTSPVSLAIITHGAWKLTHATVTVASKACIFRTTTTQTSLSILAEAVFRFLFIFSGRRHLLELS